MTSYLPLAMGSLATSSPAPDAVRMRSAMHDIFDRFVET